MGPTAAKPGNHGDAENVKRALDALTDASLDFDGEIFHSRVRLERTNPVGDGFFSTGFFNEKISQHL